MRLAKVLSTLAAGLLTTACATTMVSSTHPAAAPKGPVLRLGEGHFACTNCHADLEGCARHPVAKVTFPSGLTVDGGDNSMNLCMTCHQGRESTVSVNKSTAGMPPDTPNPKVAFVHAHYFQAGATP